MDREQCLSEANNTSIFLPNMNVYCQEDSATAVYCRGTTVRNIPFRLTQTLSARRTLSSMMDRQVHWSMTAVS